MAEKKAVERTGLITMKGGPLTLFGDPVGVGDKAPDVELTANDLSTVKISSFLGRKLVLCSVPSLDTGVCDMEARKFNQKAATLGGGAAVVFVSVDLPFAQKRWCGAADAHNVTTLSDYRYGWFGTKYGVLIKELRLLARAIFVVDPKGTIQYVQLVKEVATEPDYDAVLEAVRKLE